MDSLDPAPLRPDSPPLLDVDDSMVCAGLPAGGKDSCVNDRGGPLVADADSWRPRDASENDDTVMIEPGPNNRFTGVADYVETNAGFRVSASSELDLTCALPYSKPSRRSRDRRSR